jgi:PTH1 family peptidyl-tRNA hydrolase
MVTRLVVGLGNPGPEYEWTPHNVGFHTLDHLARHVGVIFEPATRLEGYAGPREFQFARCFDPDALLVVKPATWMNLSGKVVAPISTRLGIPPERIFVVYDDIDLPLGGLRIRPHGGTGGHRGMRSIRDELGTDRHPRLRIGVGRPKTDAARHVTTRFTPAERVEAEISVAEAAEAILDWLRSGDLEKCMTRYHSRWNQGDPPPAHTQKEDD